MSREATQYACCSPSHCRALRLADDRVCLYPGYNSTRAMSCSAVAPRGIVQYCLSVWRGIVAKVVLVIPNEACTRLRRKLHHCGPQVYQRRASIRQRRNRRVPESAVKISDTRARESLSTMENRTPRFNYHLRVHADARAVNQFCRQLFRD